MAPANFWPVLIFGLGILYFLLAHATSMRQAFLFGWLFAFGYFLCGLTWVGNALLVDGNPYLWALPLAVAGLPFILAFFPAFGCLLAWRYANLKTLPGYFAFAGGYALLEFGRGHLFTGFPWNLFGYAWADYLPVVQVVSLGNVYYLTWLTILWLSAGGFLLLWEAPRLHKILLCTGLLASFGACYGYGAARLQNYTPEYHENFRFRIVQPNIPQDQKWNRAKMAENFFKHVKLSYPPDDSTQTTYLIWPETALSHWFAQDPGSMYVLTQALQSYRGKAYLLTGLLRKNEDTDTYTNSLVLIDQQGNISNIYDKHHLVPFGEYIPYQQWIPIKPVAEFSGFARGSGPKTFATPEGLKYSPLVCYEAIFPGAVAGESRGSADVMVNITNDAWYGISAGPHQHLTNVMYRAVEEGMPLVRSANTGISALIDPMGHVIHSTELFTDAVSEVKLSKKIVVFRKSVYFENAIFIILMICSMVFPYIRKSKPKH
jgi:apolipoprotein N-acyltransferase